METHTERCTQSSLWLTGRSPTLPPACLGLFYLLAFTHAFPSPMLFLPPKHFAHCPPAAWISARLGAPSRQGSLAVPSTRPEHRGSQEALALMWWSVGGRPSGCPSPSPLVGTADLPQGRGQCQCRRQTCREGTRAPVYSLTTQLSCPGPQPPRPGHPHLPLVTAGLLPVSPPARPISTRQLEGSRTLLHGW